MFRDSRVWESLRLLYLTKNSITVSKSFGNDREDKRSESKLDR